jgi:hypothetical protein
MSINYRQERIERLLNELRYEVERGMMEGELDESLGFQFIVPVSKSMPGGVVLCSFRTRPQFNFLINSDHQPNLRVVK